MAVAVGDIVRIVAFQRIITQDVINTFHFKVALNDSLNDTDFMVRVAALLDGIYAPLGVDISDQLDYINVDGQNVTKNELLPVQGWPTLVSGANTSALLPRQSALCIFFRSLRPNTRASKFLGGYTEGANALDGGIFASVVTTALVWGTALVDGLTDGVVTLDYGAYNKVADRFTPVILAAGPSFWRTQKRRVPGFGS